MSTYNSPTNITPGTLAKASDINNVDDATATAFGLLPTNANINAGKINFAVDTGAANAYLVALPQTAAAYSDGLQVVMRPLAENTGASTINVDSLGAKAIRLPNSAVLTAGDIRAGAPVLMVYSTATGFFHIQTSVVSITGTLAVSNGGTGATSLADGGLIIGNGTGAVEVVGAGLTTQILVGGGALTAPVWGTDIPTAVTIGSAYIYRAGGTDVPVTDGGTGGSTASITLFNNITGFTAAGTTGTTSTNLVFSTSPTLVTPALGTPTSGVLSSCTGYPLSALTGAATLISLEALTIAAGTLIYGTAADTVAALGAGAITAILVGGGAAAPVWTTATGTLAPVRANTPTLVTPEIGAATGTSLVLPDAGYIGIGAATLYKDNIIKAWINLNGIGTIAIRDSYNVTSITDNGTGLYTITWDVDFADTNYACVVTSGDDSANCFAFAYQTANYLAGSVRILLSDYLGYADDAAIVSVIAIGDQ